MKNIFKLFVIILFSFYCNSVYSKFFTCYNSQDTSKISIKNKRNTIVEVVDSISGKIKYYGIASFYSSNLEGTKTSTDEIFVHNKMTCASNRFKLNTWLRVTNLANGKSIVVRVNDRMHPRMDRKGRIVDLSFLGAQKLGFVKKGIAKVRVEKVEKGTKK